MIRVPHSKYKLPTTVVMLMHVGMGYRVVDTAWMMSCDLMVPW